jgi:hypothetical protein
VINKGRIIAAGQKSKIKVPKNATVVDETGKAPERASSVPDLWGTKQD